jgi:hypothetical protein
MQNDLLAVLQDEPSGALGFSVAWTRLNLKLGAAVPRRDFEAAVEALTAEKKVKQTPGGEETKLALVGRASIQPITPRSQAPEPTAGDLVDQGDVPESSLMQPLVAWISAVHAPSYSPSHSGHPGFVVSDTSRSGAATGVWSRPDVTVASVRRHRFSNLRHVELTGYEIKRAGEGTVVAVHEALAHKRWVHRAYLVLFTPNGYDDAHELEDLKGECARHGVGLISFAHIHDYGQYREVLQARKDAVDPGLVDDFILKRMDSSVADLTRLMEQ